jgi:hypothetical protein
VESAQTNWPDGDRDGEDDRPDRQDEFLGAPRLALAGIRSNRMVSHGGAARNTREAFSDQRVDVRLDRRAPRSGGDEVAPMENLKRVARCSGTRRDRAGHADLMSTRSPGRPVSRVETGEERLERARTPSSSSMVWPSLASPIQQHDIPREVTACR